MYLYLCIFGTNVLIDNYRQCGLDSIDFNVFYEEPFVERVRFQSPSFIIISSS